MVLITSSSTFDTKMTSRRRPIKFAPISYLEGLYLSHVFIRHGKPRHRARQHRYEIVLRRSLPEPKMRTTLQQRIVTTQDTPLASQDTTMIHDDHSAGLWDPEFTSSSQQAGRNITNYIYGRKTFKSKGKLLKHVHTIIYKRQRCTYSCNASPVPNRTFGDATTSTLSAPGSLDFFQARPERSFTYWKEPQQWFHHQREPQKYYRQLYHPRQAFQLALIRSISTVLLIDMETDKQDMILDFTLLNKGTNRHPSKLNYS
ncbi:hypothetical protein CONLIGDRAFT_692384 [Coniochaeta ligniaria NRRL 30616]|uniref:Uncharacterized protein n=1 Tax=Coniochaeta ligniaria NRRL 30616 TaxID=1408157 RepID=A0A1J7I933_9PEZI|nr:hypothetical protein CONLIGDRAFT_692384 [Coniochaeta ligniaria NRRL 30616]